MAPILDSMALSRMLFFANIDPQITTPFFIPWLVPRTTVAVIVPNFCALVTAMLSCLRTAILSFDVFPLCRCPEARSWILLPRKQARLQAP
jgi:hypothetical protein